MKIGERGISAIVATVLIILITVAAVTIIWVAIIPVISDDLNVQGVGVVLTVVTLEGYSVWDSESGIAIVQVRRGADNSNISYMQVLFNCGGNTYSFRLSAPGRNQRKTEKFDLGADCELDSVSVAPIFGILNKEEIGHVSSKVKNLPEGDLVISLGDTYIDSDGVIHDVECLGDGDCSGGTPYCFEEKCVVCLDVSHCGDGDDCTQDVCSGNVCSNPFEIVEVLCDSGAGECDGAGNCGVCSDVLNPCFQLECKEEILCAAGSCVEQNDLAAGISCASGNGICDGSGTCVVTENFCLWDVQGDCDIAKGLSICDYGLTSPGVGSVAIGGESEIVNMEFTIWQTCSDSFELFVNDQLIGSFGAFGTTCDCIPSVEQWPGTFVVDGAAVNDYWNFGGTNTISLNPLGYDVVSSISVNITYKSLA